MATDINGGVATRRGILQNGVNYEQRLLPSLEEVERVIGHLKGMGFRIVLTSGSFDLVHLGHVKYLARAHELGDILVVGVDSDEKIRRRKGPDRPMVPEGERLEMLAHQRPVDLIYLKGDDPKWALIKAVRPDTLVVSEDHGYTRAQLKELREYCGHVEVLERQAEVTTSERIRQMQLNLGERIGEAIGEAIPAIVETAVHQR
jgi:D-beta-D-heptose 7-phosphate kinase/D-beta-D-heptose 1-phosphate adenosyltransferase